MSQGKKFFFHFVFALRKKTSYHCSDFMIKKRNDCTLASTAVTNISSSRFEVSYIFFGTVHIPWSLALPPHCRNIDLSGANGHLARYRYDNDGVDGVTPRVKVSSTADWTQTCFLSLIT